MRLPVTRGVGNLKKEKDEHGVAIRVDSVAAFLVYESSFM